MNRGRVLGLGVLGLVLSACPNQEDVTPLIHVTPGAADRAWLMGRGKADKKAAENVHATRISILRAETALGGPNAVGRAGDLLLENDEVAFVIDQLGSGSGFEQSGGNLVDAADSKTRRDELGQLFTFFGEFPRQAVYDKISSDVKDGIGIVTASGKELRDPSLAITTVYSLRPTDRALLVETSLENTGNVPSAKLGLGDAIQWGGADKFAPGKPSGFKGDSKGAFLGGVGRFTSYAIASTDGDIEAVSGSAWSDTFQRRDVVLKPHEKVHYARVFIVGERNDSASVIAELTKTAGGDVGTAAFDLTDAGGKKIPVDDGARVSLSRNGSEVLGIAASENKIAAEVPPGEYDAIYGGGAGRSALGSPVRITVKKNEVAHASVGVTEVAHLSLACTNSESKPMPCKLTFEGLAGTRPIDFGSASVAGPAKNQITSGTGIVSKLPISPGKYRLTASRGPEFEIVQKELVLAPGSDDAFAAQLHHVLDVTGYLGCDFHQHTMLGADAATSTIDRVISNVAEGVTVAVTSEHNVVADLMPVVREAKLEDELVEIPGDEVTSDAALIPWGHANIFPLRPNPSLPRNGALDATRPPKDVFDVAAKITYPHVIQVNHPRAWNIGYFDLAHYDPATGTASAAWYDGRFDALEVWNGRNVESRDKVRADYFSLLVHGHPVTPTANTDTHGVVGQEAGYPRTYVRVENSAGVIKGWNDARTADLVEGLTVRRDTVLTNGPFLRVSVNGAGIGGIARAKNGTVAVHVDVTTAKWISVEKVGVVLASGAVVEKKIMLSASSDHLGGKADFAIKVTKDDALSVYVTGDKPLSPVLAGDLKEISPYAMTAAIWVDADGDGKTLGRSSP